MPPVPGQVSKPGPKFHKNGLKYKSSFLHHPHHPARRCRKSQKKLKVSPLKAVCRERSHSSVSSRSEPPKKTFIMNTIKKYPVMEGKYIVKVNIVKMA
jgi:hypothetical protein